MPQSIVTFTPDRPTLYSWGRNGQVQSKGVALCDYAADYLELQAITSRGGVSPSLKLVIEKDPATLRALANALLAVADNL
jgi:hypothetical protein